MSERTTVNRGKSYYASDNAIHLCDTIEDLSRTHTSAKPNSQLQLWCHLFSATFARWRLRL